MISFIIIFISLKHHKVKLIFKIIIVLIELIASVILPYITFKFLYKIHSSPLGFRTGIGQFLGIIFSSGINVLLFFFYNLLWMKIQKRKNKIRSIIAIIILMVLIHIFISNSFGWKNDFDDEREILMTMKF
jgi:predicted permease